MRPALTILVLAKAPAAGRSKTRLAPAFGPDGAAELAAAALQDTVDAVAAAGVSRRVLVLDGVIAAPFDVVVPAGFEVVPQIGGGHADRIAAALAGCTEPSLLIGMDTPQVSPELLTVSADVGVDAWFGPAWDGGWWALGLREPARHARAALAGVPMSTSNTGAAQLVRLRTLGLAVAALPVLRDVDEPADAAAVAAQAPGGRFAGVHAALAGRAAGSGRAAGVALVGTTR